MISQKTKKKKTKAILDRYSLLVEDLELVVYFLDIHEFNESPKKIQNPVFDCHVSKHVSSSTLVKALRWSSDFEEKNNPIPMVPLT